MKLISSEVDYGKQLHRCEDQFPQKTNWHSCAQFSWVVAAAVDLVLAHISLNDSV